MEVLSAITHCIEDVMIISEIEEQDTAHLNTMVTPMTNKAWLINPAKIQGPFQMVKFIGITWAGATETFHR